MLGIGIGIGKGRNLITHGGGNGGGGPGPFPVNAVNFDGTNDYLTLTGPLSGAVDGANLLISFWFNILGGDDAGQVLLQSGSNNVQVQRSSANKFSILLRTVTPTSIWAFTTDTLYDTVNNPGWHHFLMAAELDVTPVGQLFIDDIAASITETVAPTAGDIEWVDQNWGFGASSAGAGKYTGDMAEVYATNEYLDISQVSNRRKFIDANGFPVDLGAGGITPTGTVPLLLFSGATGTWHTNDGSGGGMTEVGALTDAATSPSD